MDWYEAWADLGGERTRLQVFAMRSMASGAAFHRAYLHATQQAFLEAHEQAFAYFGGVFRLLRYDNLASAVRKILRGHRREETVRFVAFRSHWRFAAEFCTPGEGHEKGGVEGEGGYFRRNHLVPVPGVADLDALNALLLTGCREDEARILDGRTRAGRRGDGGGARPAAAPRSRRGSSWPRSTFPLVDKQGCVMVKTNAYSVPVRAGTRVEARVYPLHVEVWHAGRRIARHERCHRPSSAGAGPGALPRRAGPQARRVRRVQATGAMAPGRSLAGLLRRALGSAAGPARQAERHPRHGGGRGAGSGVRPRRAARRDRHGGLARRLRRGGGALSADRGRAAQSREPRSRSMSASWPATTGRCRRWPNTTCCSCPAPARGTA